MRIYERALKIQSAEDMATFQDKWGELCNVKSLDVEYGMELIEDLRRLARGLRFEEGKEETLQAASKNGFFQGAFHIDPSDGTLFIKVRTLLEYMRIEIWMEYVTGRPLQKCEHCGKLFRTGGRGSTSLRADAKYCSPSCRTMASRERKRIQM